MTRFGDLLRRLVERGVDCIVVGGIAGVAHGAARATYDLDVVYDRKPGNLRRLAGALEDLSPSLRGAPPGLPFRLDSATLRSGLNFTLTTEWGDLDLLGEIVGGGTYDELFEETVIATMFGVECRCLTLDRLIAVKRAAGRPKDLEAIAELEALREERS